MDGLDNVMCEQKIGGLCVGVGGPLFSILVVFSEWKRENETVMDMKHATAMGLRCGFVDDFHFDYIILRLGT